MANLSDQEGDHVPHRPKSIDSKTTTLKDTTKSSPSSQRTRPLHSPISTGSIPEHRPKAVQHVNGDGGERNGFFLADCVYLQKLDKRDCNSDPRCYKSPQIQHIFTGLERIQGLGFINQMDLVGVTNRVEIQTITVLNDEPIDSVANTHTSNTVDSPEEKLEYLTFHPIPKASDTSIGARLDFDWGIVEKAREHVRELRDCVQEQRRIVVVLEKDMAEADERYIALIRSGHVGVFSDGETDLGWKDELDKRWKSCQEARDKHGPADYELTSLEDQLSADESRLTQLERQLYREWQSHPGLLVPSFENQSSENSKSKLSLRTRTTEHNQSSSGVSEREQYHPFHEEYLERLGDLDILEEQQTELLFHKAILEEEKTLRKGVGENLQPEDLEFLDSFTTLEADKAREIRIAKFDVSRLKARCVQHKLVDEEDNVIQQQRRLALEGNINPGSTKSLPNPESASISTCSPTRRSF